MVSDYPQVIIRTIVEPPPRDRNGCPIGSPAPFGPPVIKHLPGRR